MNKILSDDLIDQMVNELTKLPYRDVIMILRQLGEEIQEQKNDQPQILVKE